MGVRLTPAAFSRADDAGATILPPRWTCALVNNMPDGAFDATERQYLDLLGAGSGDDVLEVRRYTVEGVPEGRRRPRGSSGTTCRFWRSISAHRTY